MLTVNTAANDIAMHVWQTYSHCTKITWCRDVYNNIIRISFTACMHVYYLVQHTIHYICASYRPQCHMQVPMFSAVAQYWSLLYVDCCLLLLTVACMLLIIVCCCSHAVACCCSLLPSTCYYNSFHLAIHKSLWFPQYVYMFVMCLCLLAPYVAIA